MTLTRLLIDSTSFDEAADAWAASRGLDVTTISEIGGLQTALDSKADITYVSSELSTNSTNDRDRTNHTGTQSADTIVDGTTNKVFTSVEKTKLSGISSGATVNSTDAELRDRGTHTGSQPISSIGGLQTELNRLVGGPMTSTVWLKVPSIFRLRMTGTGSVVIDSKNTLGTITTNVDTYSLTGETNKIEFPYYGDDLRELRATLVGSVTCEVL